MTIVHTRQNALGNFWCHGTINGCDESFEAPYAGDAQMLMKYFLKRKGITNVCWMPVVMYVFQPKPTTADISYQRNRIDHL